MTTVFNRIKTETSALNLTRNCNRLIFWWAYSQIYKKPLAWSPFTWTIFTLKCLTMQNFTERWWNKQCPLASILRMLCLFMSLKYLLIQMDLKSVILYNFFKEQHNNTATIELGEYSKMKTCPHTESRSQVRDVAITLPEGAVNLWWPVVLFPLHVESQFHPPALFEAERSQHPSWPAVMQTVNFWGMNSHGLCIVQGTGNKHPKPTLDHIKIFQQDHRCFIGMWSLNFRNNYYPLWHNTF